MILWRRVICIHLDADARIIHRHCIIQPGSLSAKLPGRPCTQNTRHRLHHSSSPHLIINPLLQQRRHCTVTLSSWQPFKNHVLDCLVTSLSPIRSFDLHSKKWIVFKGLWMNGFIVFIPPSDPG